ncbi:MAG TPA: hypothetical protein VJ011_13120 [Steroidobacteraceae bacterium]|nr:hypothetical protein [Steroidobacteraceae bacterium]
MARKVNPPADVRAALEELLGESVRTVQVVEYSWFARAHIRAVATTRPRRIYLRGSASEFFSDPILTLHEYCHVTCQWQPGRLTVFRYLLEWFRRGYWDNRFEIEAREFADDNVYRYRALLARHREPGAVAPVLADTPASLFLSR